VHAGHRRPRRGQEAIGRNLRWYPAPTAEERGPDGPPARPTDPAPPRLGGIVRGTV
jgi:hypothetical protein